MRCGLNRGRICFGKGHDFDQIVHEPVQGLLVLCFSGLQHQAFLDDQRKVDRGCMISPVQQSLGNIQGPHPVLRLFRGGSHEFVHAGAIVGDLQVILQPFSQVVGGQDRIFADSDKTFPAQPQNIRIRLEHDPEISVEGRDVADGLGIIVIEEELSVFQFDHPGDRQVRLQPGADTDRS